MKILWYLNFIRSFIFHVRLDRFSAYKVNRLPFFLKSIFIQERFYDSMIIKNLKIYKNIIQWL